MCLYAHPPPYLFSYLQAMQFPKHLSKDITEVVNHQQTYTADSFLMGDEARAMEQARREMLAEQAAAKAAEEEAAAIEAAKIRKHPSMPSFTGGFEARKLQMVPVGGALTFSGSAVGNELGVAPPYVAPTEPPPKAADPALPVRATGAADAEEEAEEASATKGAEALLASSLDSHRSGGKMSVPPLTQSLKAQPFAEPPSLPPPAHRMSARVPPRVDGGERMEKVLAPVVSEQPAQAAPNLLNLLLEVPYKRGVHTVSVNQRYLNHEPTFDPAFELLPAAAQFGALRAGCIYRFRLILTNVSNLPQRFVVKPGQQAKIVCQPGVVAAGLSRDLEVELNVPESSAGPLAENVTFVTEREEILLPVVATVLSPDEHDAQGHPPFAPGVRMIATAPRDSQLGRTVPLTTRDLGPGTKRFDLIERGVYPATGRDPERPAFNFDYGLDEEDGVLDAE